MATGEAQLLAVLTIVVDQLTGKARSEVLAELYYLMIDTQRPDLARTIDEYAKSHKEW